MVHYSILSNLPLYDQFVMKEKKKMKMETLLPTSVFNFSPSKYCPAFTSWITCYMKAGFCQHHDRCCCLCKFTVCSVHSVMTMQSVCGPEGLNLCRAESWVIVLRSFSRLQGVIWFNIYIQISLSWALNTFNMCPICLDIVKPTESFW